MVKLKLKVGEKGQVLIPKIFRDKYGIKEGQHVALEPREEGLLLKGRPSPDEAIASLRAHATRMRELRIKGPQLGDLKNSYQEMEYD